jgi:hypothetical protein
MKRQVAITGFVTSGILAIAIVLGAKGSSNVVLEGTLQQGFEESDFYPNGDCSKNPLWWESHNEHLDDDLDARWEKIGSNALHVKVRCNVSSVGMHGHLGGYLREIQPFEIVSVGPAHRCR